MRPTLNNLLQGRPFILRRLLGMWDFAQPAYWESLVSRVLSEIDAAAKFFIRGGYTFPQPILLAESVKYLFARRPLRVNDGLFMPGGSALTWLRKNSATSCRVSFPGASSGGL